MSELTGKSSCGSCGFGSSRKFFGRKRFGSKSMMRSMSKSKKSHKSKSMSMRKHKKAMGPYAKFMKAEYHRFEPNYAHMSPKSRFRATSKAVAAAWNQKKKM